jgi:hypothetical protein
MKTIGTAAILLGALCSASCEGESSLCWNLEDECSTVGEARCLSSEEIEECVYVSDGCYRWRRYSCADDWVAACSEVDGVAACRETCTDDCSADEPGSCELNVVVACMDSSDVDSCLHWTEIDCTETGQTCAVSDGVAHCQ